MSDREIMNAKGFGKKPKKGFIEKIKIWWKNFIKNHIIDKDPYEN